MIQNLLFPQLAFLYVNCKLTISHNVTLLSQILVCCLYIASFPMTFFVSFEVLICSAIFHIKFNFIIGQIC